MPISKPDTTPLIRLNAACVGDAEHEFCPGSLVVRRDESGGLATIAAGPPGEVDRALVGHPPLGETIDLPGSTILPPLVNAHTHLDLTHIMPQPYNPDVGFSSWLDIVRAGRRTDDAGIAESVRLGIAKSRAGGVAAVGDIAGSVGRRLTLAPWRTLREAGMPGVSFVEFFAIGSVERLYLDLLEQLVGEHAEELADRHPARARLGLSPHAPYTVSLAAYRRAIELADRFDPPLSQVTHLAESLDERMLIFDAIGPKRVFLETVGIWEDRLIEEFAQGKHPVEHLAPILEHANTSRALRTSRAWQQAEPKAGARPNMLAVHVNDCPDDAIDTLVRTKTPVVYCPRASAYFGEDQHFGPHRYRDLLAAGVEVCLGTDSIINLDTPDRITPLDDARLLYRRDGTDPKTLLEMMTTGGARALGLDEHLFCFDPGGLLAGVIAIDNADSLEACFRCDGPPRYIEERVRGSGGPRKMTGTDQDDDSHK